jgi:flavodoxin
MVISNGLKSLVVFYSLEGNTKFIAAKIAQVFGADTLELKPEKEINSGSAMRFFWGGGQVVMKETPKLKEYKINLNDYSLIIIGTPVWAFNYTPPIRTFLKENKITGKKLILFCTHGGAKGKTFENLSAGLADNEIIGAADFFNVLKDKEKNLAKLDEFFENVKIKLIK